MMAEPFEQIVRQLAAINPGEISYDRVRALILAAKKAVTPPAPEPPAPALPWKCCICGEPVLIGDDLRPYHLGGPAVHEAELSDEDRKTLADGLRLTD